MALSYTSNYVRDINQKLSVSYKYGDGYPVLKELIQNADDAGASELRIYVVDGINDAKTSILKQPAIVVYNDGEFRKEHLKNILTMSVDSKTTDNSKIGRYGLGMKSIFHICDAFIFAICKKPDFLDIKIDCISPWAPNDPDHDYLNFPDDEERQLVLKNLPFDLKKDNGFVLYLPIQEPGKPHVIQEHKISKDKPFGLINDVLNNIGTTLPLLCEVSPSKTLKKVKYFVNTKDCKSVSIDNKNKLIVTENDGNKIKESYCVFNADVSKETLSKFSDLTKNENWNQREEKKEIKPEITFELIRNNREVKELGFKYCVYLPMEEPKINPVKINTRNGFTVLVHGNFAIDSGRRGFIGFSTLLNKQEDTVIEGTDSLQIMWNKILAQEIMFPSFPKFLEHCVNSELLVFNKSTDEVAEFLNSFKNIQFDNIPFINHFTCVNNCFGKVISFRKGKYEINWKSFDSHLNMIKLPELSDFTKVYDVFSTVETANCVYVSHTDSQFQIIPSVYNPNEEVIETLIKSLSVKTLTDINLCKWFRAFIELNENAFRESDDLINLLIAKIKENLIKCNLSDLSGNSKNLGELLSLINRLTGDTCKKFLAVNINDDCWKQVWSEKEDFVFVPSFLTITDNYIEDDYVINPFKSICHYLEASSSIPSENHFDIIQRIIGKKRFDALFQTIADSFETLSIFRIKNVKKDTFENATRDTLNILVEKGLLFYATSNFKENSHIKLYAKLIDSLDIYSIPKSDNFRDDRILSPDDEKDIFKSFQLQDYRHIDYDKKFLADFLEKMFDYSFQISSNDADFYRFLFTNCNKNLRDETICFNNGDEIWKKIYKYINPNTFFIPDNFHEHTKRQITENEKVLKIFPLDAKHCLNAMNDAFNLNFFKDDEYFLQENVQEILFKEFQEYNKELYLRIPLQFDSISKQYIAPREKICYLNSNGIEIPKNLNPNYYLIEPSSNEVLASKQKLFLTKLEYKRAAESIIALSVKAGVNAYDEIFGLLSHIDNWENFADPSSCGCALIKWIPVRGSSSYCSIQQVIDDSLFTEPVRNYLTSHFDLYSKDQILLSDEKFTKLHSKKMIPGTSEKVFSYFIQPFSEKLYFKFQFNTVEEFNSCCYTLRDFENVPVYSALYKLLNSCTNENSKDLIFNLYKSLTVKSSVDKQIDSLKDCLIFLSSQNITKSCEKIFEKTLENFLELGKDSFKITDYKYPVQDDTWKVAEEIAATDDLDYEPTFLLKKNIFDLLNKNGLIKSERGEVDSSASYLENRISSDDSIETIRKTFAPWFECENLEHPKLLYMLFFLLQGNFSKYALDEKNITYFDCFTKEYSLDTIDNNPKLWINNTPASEVFTSFNHFKTIIHIPKGNTVPLSNLVGKKIPVPQANSENPNTLYSDRAWLSNPDPKSNVFHLELKQITKTVHELDRKLQELIESQVLASAYRQFFNKDGYKLFTAFLETNQNTVKSTVLYIFDSLFDKLSGMGLKANKDFKDLYTQYTELFNRQTSLDNEKFQSYELDKKQQKQDKINEDKQRLNDELKSLILTNAEMQHDLHAAVKKQISKNQYSVSRILYELLQNADDSVCDISDSPTFEERRKFSVTVKDNAVIVSHYGRRINETPAGINHTDKFQYDLKNMLALNASDKDEGDTGQFGLGFKSIYLASNEPVLRSGELQFKILGALYPQKLDYEEKLNEFETRIEFTITEDNVSISDLLADFKKTAAIQPLLCRGINEIIINESGVPESEELYCVKPVKKILDSTFGKITSVILDGQTYLVIEGSNNLYKMIFKEREGQIDIFKSASKEHIPRIWNLAPFAEYENLPFIINACFDLDPGRTSLSKVDNKNKILLDEISDSVTQLLCELNNGDDYSVGIFKSLLHIFLYTTNSPEKLFSEFATRILKLVADAKDIIPTGTREVIPSAASICSITANTFGLKPDDNEFITVLNTIQNVFGDNKYVVSNVVRETFSEQWKQIDSYETLLIIFSELHDYVLDNVCLEGFLEIKKNTDHDEEINWNIFKLRNKDGIPKTVNTFTFSNASSEDFEIINEEYSAEVIEFFSRQEFAKNNDIAEKENEIETQKKSIAELSFKNNKLMEAIRTRNFDGLDLDDSDYDDYDDIEPDTPPVPSLPPSTFSWKNEYFRLIRDIRSFMKETRTIISNDDLYGNKSNLADISNFGQEKSIWKHLQDQQELIIGSNSYEFPINTDGWKDFLSSAYKGRCQLCGERTAINVQDAYSWTFRIVKESDNRLANIKSNLFCLCPTCHGKMGYGKTLGKDLSKVVEAAEIYSNFIDEQISNPDNSDEMPPLIKEMVNEDIDIKGFINPIVFDVTINGSSDNKLVFSWEHFLRLAFIFSHLNDFDENDLIEPETDANYYGTFPEWHGTEWVTGHYRTRNGQTEYVRGHWRTR